MTIKTIAPGDVYLAGKVTCEDRRARSRAFWRESFGVSIEAEYSFNDATFRPDYTFDQFLFGDQRYPIAGPHAIECDHGCSHSDWHGDNGHCAISCTESMSGPARRGTLALHTMSNLRFADTVIAWIDGEDLHGTIFEVGYALRSPAVRTVVGVADEALAARYWFLLEAVQQESHVPFVGPLDGFASHVRSLIERPRPRLDSPLEEALYDAMPVTMQGEVVTQHEVGRYRLDFAFVGEKLCIEVDGRTYHSDEAAFTRDRTRDRWLTANGWRVIRFASDEVFADPVKCVGEIEALRLVAA